MPKREQRIPGYSYITVAIEEDDYRLLRSYAAALNLPITRAAAEIFHQARAMMELSSHIGEGIEGVQMAQNVADTLRRELRRALREEPLMNELLAIVRSEALRQDREAS